MLTRALLVFAVCGLRTAERARQVRRGCEARGVRIDPTLEPAGDLLQQPTVPFRVVERHERQIAAPGRVGAARLRFDFEWIVPPGDIVKDLARVDTLPDQLLARRLDVRDDEVEELCRTESRRSDARSEDDGTWRARRRELEHPTVTRHDVCIPPPSEPSVEFRRAGDVRHWNDDNLELHVDRLRSRGLGCRFAARLGTAHIELLRLEVHWKGNTRPST